MPKVPLSAVGNSSSSGGVVVVHNGGATSNSGSVGHVVNAMSSDQVNLMVQHSPVTPTSPSSGHYAPATSAALIKAYHDDNASPVHHHHLHHHHMHHHSGELIKSEHGHLAG